VTCSEMRAAKVLLSAEHQRYEDTVRAVMVVVVSQ
jgi:hypothetical protein